MENSSNFTNKLCYNQDAVVLFRLSNLGAFVFEFTLDAVIIKSAVVFAPIRYLNVRSSRVIISYLEIVWHFKKKIYG